ncbi:MAG: tetratricopeptide repeat protein [Bacteroidales bacterium]|jgi:tetratricopeptide (TPR) repeat protein|nr:tetratricopeptide repeat protein [Bacteroidales bacterium]
MSESVKQKQEKGKENISFVKKIDHFYQKNQKPIWIAGVAVAVVVLVALIYFLWYIPSQENAANQAIIRAERYFEVDSLNLAVNGDGMHQGLKDVVDEYGMTKTGNRAKYLLGICYLRMGQYDDAIKYLKKFSSSDKLVSVQALGSIGDAYMEKNDMSQAEAYYKKAVSKNQNDLVTPVYLQRLGMLYQMQGKWSDALTMYQTIQKEHPQSAEASDIDKRIEFVKGKL